MKFIYLAIFIIDTALHLYASYKNDKHFRDVTKGIILLSVLGFYLESIDTPSWFIIIALLLSWFGDMFLIPHGVKWFTIGGIGFMISHIFFILGYQEITNFNNVNLVFLIAIPLIFVIYVSFYYKKLAPHLPKPLVVPMYFYLVINGLMNAFAEFRMISGFTLGTLLTAIGALLFFVSDNALFFVRFNKETKQKSHFLVMLTYSLGELLIVLGLVI